MLWAADLPQPLEETVKLLRRFRGQFDLGRDFVYGIFPAGEEEVVGGTGLHTRHGEGAFEIGYWIRSSRAGEGLATEATAALTRIAFELCGVDRVEIRTDPANERSRSIPRRLGYSEEATLRRRLRYPEPRDAIVYTMFGNDFPGTPAATAQFEAYDALGERIWPE